MKIDSNDFVVRIDELLHRKNIKREAVCKAAGVVDNSLTTWKKRGTIPSADVAAKMAKYLNTSVEWLVLGEEPNGFSNDDIKLIEKWHEISDEGRKAVQKLLDSYARDAEDEKNKGMASS